MISRTSPRQLGRVIALLFLLTIITGVFAQGFVSDRLYVSNDAAATATNFLTQRHLYELGFSVGIIETFARVFFIAPLFVLGNSASVFPGFTTQQLQSISLILFKVNSQGTALAMAFFS